MVDSTSCRGGTGSGAATIGSVVSTVLRHQWYQDFNLLTVMALLPGPGANCTQECSRLQAETMVTWQARSNKRNVHAPACTYAHVAAACMQMHLPPLQQCPWQL